MDASSRSRKRNWSRQRTVYSKPGEAVIGVPVRQRLTFELINASQVASMSVGLHPRSGTVASRTERLKEMYGGEGKGG
jgi:hypothetical protein